MERMKRSFLNKLRHLWEPQVTPPRPGSSPRDLSILYCEIANYEALCQAVPLEQLSELLNRYFESAVNDCIYKTEGTVIKFVNDTIFAIWNAPDDQPDHPVRACQTALSLRDVCNQAGLTRPTPELECHARIGLHCGPANVGNFGSTTRIDYTAMGSNVDLALSILKLNEALGTSVLVSAEVVSRVQGQYLTRSLGLFGLRGSQIPVEVHELLPLGQRAWESRAWCETFSQAIRSFQNRDWDAACAGFDKVRELKSGDSASGFFLKQLAQFRQHPPGPDWQGQIELRRE